MKQSAGIEAIARRLQSEDQSRRYLQLGDGALLALFLRDRDESAFSSSKVVEDTQQIDKELREKNDRLNRQLERLSTAKMEIKK